MYECKEIAPMKKNFEGVCFTSNGRYIRKCNVGATVEEDYIVFHDDNLRALGVTEGYIDFFYKQYLYFSRLLETAKKENILALCPDDKWYQNDIRRFENEKHFYEWELKSIHRCSVLRVKCPEEEWKGPIYWWMGWRDYVRDVPEIQKFKIFPGFKYTEGESYLYYYDREKYDKFCKEPPKFKKPSLFARLFGKEGDLVWK